MSAQATSGGRQHRPKTPSGGPGPSISRGNRRRGQELGGSLMRLPWGGWYRTSRVEGHDLDEVTATVVQFQALCMASNLGIPARREVVKGASAYFLRVLEKPRPTGDRAMETAAAIVCGS